MIPFASLVAVSPPLRRSSESHSFRICRLDGPIHRRARQFASFRPLRVGQVGFVQAKSPRTQPAPVLGSFRNLPSFAPEPAMRARTARPDWLRSEFARRTARPSRARENGFVSSNAGQLLSAQ